MRLNVPGLSVLLFCLTLSAVDNQSGLLNTMLQDVVSRTRFTELPLKSIGNVDRAL
jgi:hypothetical protein